MNKSMVYVVDCVTAEVFTFGGLYEAERYVEDQRGIYGPGTLARYEFCYGDDGQNRAITVQAIARVMNIGRRD